MTARIMTWTQEQTSQLESGDLTNFEDLLPQQQEGDSFLVVTLVSSKVERRFSGLVLAQSGDNAT